MNENYWTKYYKNQEPKLVKETYGPLPKAYKVTKFTGRLGLLNTIQILCNRHYELYKNMLGLKLEDPNMTGECSYCSINAQKTGEYNWAIAEIQL